MLFNLLINLVGYCGDVAMKMAKVKIYGESEQELFGVYIRVCKCMPCMQYYIHIFNEYILTLSKYNEFLTILLWFSFIYGSIYVHNYIRTVRK